MNTLDINKILKNNNWTKSCFLGTFPSDKIPKSLNLPYCFVANTDPSTGKGSHWVAVYVNNKNRADYFDSYGNEPSGVIKKYLDSNCASFRYNRKQVQSFGSSVCGQHCILFLYLRCRGAKMASVMAQFQSDTVVNDTVVCLSVNGTYGSNFSLIESSSEVQRALPLREIV